MFLLDQVRILYSIVVNVFHVSDSAIFLIKLELGNHFPNPNRGICKCSDEDLKRNGCGGCEVIVYATTLLKKKGQRERATRISKT
jgi:hypothetical protein